jgi:hypothetical protein
VLILSPDRVKGNTPRAMGEKRSPAISDSCGIPVGTV